MLLDQSSDLFESSMGSVWDSNKEVLGSTAVGLFVVNVVDAVDKNDAKVLLKTLVVELKGVE